MKKLLHYAVYLEILSCFILAAVCISQNKGLGRESESARETMVSEVKKEGTSEKKFIKWVEFKVPYEALQKAYEADRDSYEKEVHFQWIELLSYLGTKYGGDFSQYQAEDMEDLMTELESGTTMQELTKEKKYYSYYLEAYTAVLGGMVGEYEIEVPKNGSETEKEWKHMYGLKAFSPVAKGYEYSDYDDFGTSRTYGYSRPHLGHDMMGQVGTPIIAVESGYVEAIGWNQYGGWRIGIRSYDKQRYYYYAHLRQNFPFNKSLEEGSEVTAGDVIGYMGHTGYSAKENVNNIDEVHLHWGLQLIFDESQKEGNNEIWVDCYDITRFLSQNRSQAVKNEETKEYTRVYDMKNIHPENQKE